MNLQEVFNKIYNHAQAKQKATNKIDGQCMYRGDNNTKCFLGCLIPDELYDPIIENKSCTCSTINFNGEEDKGVIKLIAIMKEIGVYDLREHELRDLQRIHDNNHPNDWNAKLITFANEHNLTVPTNV